MFVLFSELPFVVIDTSTKHFQQGEEIQCACLVKGFPEPTVVWNKHGKRLTSNVAIEITDDYVLKIKNAKPSDAGRYECVAWNSIGQSRAVVNLRHTGIIVSSYTDALWVVTDKRCQYCPRISYREAPPFLPINKRVPRLNGNTTWFSTHHSARTSYFIICFEH